MSRSNTVCDRERERIRWRCRRGMLELDLVLNTFLDRHLERLDASEFEAFNALLARADPDLLDLVMGRMDAGGTAERGVLTLLREGSCNERSIQSV